MSKRILLADDSLTIQKVVELTFMDEDFEVEAVGSGDEAVRSLSGDQPDIVIADVHMPGASGYEVCRQAKAANPNLPVLLLVGTFEALDEDEMVACGANGNLKKPFDSQELLQLVRDMTEGAVSVAGSEAATSEPASSEPVGSESADQESAGEAPEATPIEGLETTAHDAEDAADDDDDVPAADPITGFDLGRAADDFAVTPPDPPSGFETVGADLEGDPQIEPVDLGLDDGGAEVAATDDTDAPTGNETVFIDTVSAEPVSEAPEEAAPEPEVVLEEAAAPEPEASPGITLEDAVDEVDDAMPEDDEPAVDVGHDLDVAAPAVGGGSELSDADVERIARRVVEMMSDLAVREVAWDVIPDMAEIVIKDRIREIEAEAEAD